MRTIIILIIIIMGFSACYNPERNLPQRNGKWQVFGQSPVQYDSVNQEVTYNIFGAGLMGFFTFKEDNTGNWSNQEQTIQKDFHWEYNPKTRIMLHDYLNDTIIVYEVIQTKRNYELWRQTVRIENTGIKIWREVELTKID